MAKKDNKKKSGLLKTPKQINTGAAISGIGFLLYLLLRGLGQELLAAIAVFIFAVISTVTFFAVIDAREKDKEAVTYNLLWGTGALAIMMVAFAVLTVKQFLGL